MCVLRMGRMTAKGAGTQGLEVTLHWPDSSQCPRGKGSWGPRGRYALSTGGSKPVPLRGSLTPQNLSGFKIMKDTFDGLNYANKLSSFLMLHSRSLITLRKQYVQMTETNLTSHTDPSSSLSSSHHASSTRVSAWLLSNRST